MDTQEQLAAVIARVALGDRPALRVLYQGTAPKLYAICLRILPDQDSAERALQEVYQEIWNSAAMSRANRSSPMTWMMAVARTVATGHRRRLGAAPCDQPDCAPVLADLSVLSGAQAKAPGIGGPLGLCLREQQVADVDMLRLVCLDGLSYSDIADTMGVDPAAVQSRMRRCFTQLRECLRR
ncbi:sigma factor [Puniceibacterium confluentis]|uniref:sigma factor n=1 Tax=Puniceibacterium confluentis TaxID=1958944 RepID=UPI003561FD5E